eukprot:359359-Chlamydomonas_euryale.AAC.3
MCSPHNRGTHGWAWAHLVWKRRGAATATVQASRTLRATGHSRSQQATSTTLDNCPLQRSASRSSQRAPAVQSTSQAGVSHPQERAGVSHPQERAGVSHPQEQAGVSQEHQRGA